MAKTDENTQLSNFGNSGDDQDFWAQLLAAAQTEAARRINLSDAVDNSDNLTANGPRQFVRGELLMNTYRIDSNQIDGGMGSVWKVHHIGWNVDLAMKRPQPQLFADEVAKSNFICECQTWIDLGLHPNIVSCYYVREIEGVPTIFSEWMENGDLKERIKDGSLYIGSDMEVQERLLDIAIQFARGLHYAHQSGLIHQDVKPANLLLTKNWDAKVSDFGIARARGRLTVSDHPEENTATHIAANGIYTPAYCSMEQMDGKALTRRTDIYSWAVSVMEMYYGCCPWANGVVAGMNCENYLANCRIEVPERLRSILISCLRPDPENRPETIEHFEWALRACYKEVTGHLYPRPQPKAAPDTADSLNNRALSYLDLGMEKEADRIWSKTALKFPAHTNTLFNHTLFRVRNGQMSLYEGQCYLSANWENHFNETEPGLLLAQLSLEFKDQNTVQDVLNYLSQNCMNDTNDTAEKFQQFKNETGRGDYRCNYEISRIQNLQEQEAFDQKCDEKLSELNSLIEKGDFDQAAVELFTTHMSREYPDAIYRPDWLEFYEKLSRKCSPVHVISHWPVLSVADVNQNEKVSFSDDSRYFLCGDRLYDMKTGELVADNRISFEEKGNEFDEIRNVLKALGMDGNLAFPEGCICSQISPDGSFYLRAIEGENTFTKVNVQTGENLAVCRGHQAPISSLAISRDGRVFASGDRKGFVRLWNSDGSFAREMAFLTSSKEAVDDVQFSYDNRKLILRYGSAMFLSDQADSSVKTEEYYSDYLDISADLSYQNLAMGTGYKGLWSYNIADHEITKHEDEIAAMRGTGHAVTCPKKVCVMPDDHFVLFGDRKLLCFFDMGTDRILSAIHMPDEITQISCSRNGKFVAAVAGGKAHLWRVMYAYHGLGDDVGSDMLKACAWVQTSAHPEKTPEALLPDLMTELADRGFGGIPMYKALEALKKTRIVMEAKDLFKPLPGQKSGEHLDSKIDLSMANSFSGVSDPSFSVSSSVGRSDGSSSDRDDKPEPPANKPVKAEKKDIPSAEPEKTVVVSPDGQRIYILDNETVRCLEAETLERRYKSSVSFIVLGNVTISPDGRYLLCCGLTKESFSVTVIDTADGKTLRCLSGHKGAVNHVAPHPDGKHCYTASGDGTVRKWNYLTGVCEQESDPCDSNIWDICLSPDGETICVRFGEKWTETTFSFLDAKKLKTKKMSKNQPYGTYDMFYSADGGRVYFCSSEGDFSILSGEMEIKAPVIDGSPFFCMQEDSERKKCLLGGMSGDVCLLDSEEAHCLGTISCAEENYIARLSASADLSVIAAKVSKKNWILLKNPFVDKKSQNAGVEDPITVLMAEMEANALERMGKNSGREQGAGVQNGGTTVYDSLSSKSYSSNFSKGKILLDTYRVDSDQIDGGMGSVWKVYHTGWDVDLAMKRPQPQLFADETSKGNFIKECQTWIDLGLHPNIVSCYYVREIEGVPTIFSEWMENGSLENRIQDGSLYEGAEADVNVRLLDIAIQYARGLHYAHEKGLIHQDVKPDNLLLTGDWEAKAADFGLAKARAQLTVLEGDATLYDDAGATHMAPSGGYTPAYCSMEQMDGKLLTRRTDIYSWAVSVMEMYLGSRPWSNGVVAGMVCQSYFSAVDAKVVMPLPLQKLLARCMAADPDDRPNDFAVIEKELLNIYKNFTGKTYPRPETKAASDTADSFNNRALSYLDMGQPEKAEEYWNLAHNKEPDHAETIYNQSLYLWRRGKINGTDLIRRCASLTAGKDSGSEWQEKVRQIYTERKNSEPRSFNCQSRTVSNFGINLHHPQVCLSSDGKKIYTGFDSISCYDAVTLKEVFNRPDLVGDTLVDMLKLSSDGKYLLYHKMESYHHPTLLKDVLVNPGEAETLFIADAKTGKHLRMLTASGSYGHQKPVTAFCIHPDSTFCYTAGPDKILKWNFISGELIAEYELKKSAPGTKVGRNVFSYGTVCSIDISPDGKLLCAVILGSSSSMIAVWDEESYHLHELKEADHRISDISFSADGSAVYTCGDDGLAVWDPKTLSCYKFKTPVPLEKMWVCPDGSTILVSDSLHNVNLWKVGTWECERVFHTSEVRIESLDASSDLTMVAACDWDKNVMVWDVNAEIPRAQWELSRIKDYDVAISMERSVEHLRNEIATALEQGDIRKSLVLLEEAEKRFDPHAFFPLRRKIMAYCFRNELTNVYEISSFNILDDFFELPTMLRHGSIYPNPQENTAAVRFSRENVIQIRDDLGSRVNDFHMPEDFDGANILSSLAYSRSGKKLAVGGYDSVLVLDAQQGDVLRELRGNEEAFCFSGLSFSPDEKLLAAGTGDDHTLCLWNVDTGHLVCEWKEDILCSKRIRFMPSGDRMIVSTPSNLLLYDVKNGMLIKTIPVYEGCLDFDLSPDGKNLYLFTEEGFIQMDTVSWHTDYSFRPHERNKFSATDQYRVSPDGTLLATINVGNIQLWSLEDRSLIREIHLYETVYQLEFSPDSSMLYAVCGNVVRVYALLRELEFSGWSENTAPVDTVIDTFKAAVGQPDSEQVHLLLCEFRNRGFGFIRPEVIKAKFRK